MQYNDFVVPNSLKPPSPKSRAELAVIAADHLGDINASILARVIVRAHDLNITELFHHSRSRAPIAATRQLAMYMMHVVLGRSLTQIGIFFGRDRTTVAHACIRMEDMRDDEDFDSKVGELEEQFELAVSKVGCAKPFTSTGQANDG